MKPIGAVDVLYHPAQGSCLPPEEALSEMDAAGVAVAFIAQCNKITCERQWACVDTRLEDVARFLRASVRFAGLSGYNPFDVADSLREMEAARALGFRGACLDLPGFGLRLDDARFYPLYAKACELGQPTLVQASIAEPGVERSLGNVCRHFPELTLAIAHPQPSNKIFELCETFDRLALALDTPALAWLRRTNPAVFSDVPVVERMMWGSNGQAPANSVDDAMALGLPAATMTAILRGNALRFFAAPPPERRPYSLLDEVTSAER